MLTISDLTTFVGIENFLEVLIRYLTVIDTFVGWIGRIARVTASTARATEQLIEHGLAPFPTIEFTQE